MKQRQRPRETLRDTKNRSPNNTKYPINSIFFFPQTESKTQNEFITVIWLHSTLQITPVPRQIAVKSSKCTRIRAGPDEFDIALSTSVCPHPIT